MPLMASGLVLLVSAAFTYLSLSMPWVQVRVLTELVGSTTPRKVADLGLTARDSLTWWVGLGLAVAFAVWGVLWFWCSLDRGSGLPRLADPWLAVLAAAIGLALTAGSRLGSLVWSQGLVEHARRAGLTREQMQEILARRPAPTIEVEVLEGLFRFGVVMVIGLAASIVAWWAARRRV